MRKFRQPKVKVPRPPKVRAGLGLQKVKSPALRKFKSKASQSAGGRKAPKLPKLGKGNALGKFRSRAPKGSSRSQAPQGGPLPEPGSVRPAGSQSAQPEGSQGPQGSQEQQSLDALANAEQEQLVPTAMDRAMSALAQAEGSSGSGQRTPDHWKQSPAMMFI